MDSETKQRLERLKKENRIKIAKEQLITVLNEFYDIDISGLPFVDYQLSEDLHSLVYKRKKQDDVKTEECHFDADKTRMKLEWLFGIFRIFENDKVMIFPSAFGFYYRSSDYLYLDFPIAIISTIKEFKNNIIKLVLEIQDDLVVVEEKLKFGFVISKDEGPYIIINYWRHN